MGEVPAAAITKTVRKGLGQHRDAGRVGVNIVLYSLLQRETMSTSCQPFPFIYALCMQQLIQ